jgi:integral membrane protein (TIGR01906 family)
VQTIGGRLGGILIALGTALAILAIVMPLFLNPLWVAFEQGRSQAAAWTGFAESDLRAVTDSILADLVVGPPAFDVQLAGATVLDAREQAHMRDVRAVFIGFFAVAAIAVLGAIAVIVRRGRTRRAATWRSVRQGAIALIIALVLVGGFAVIAFDVVFEVFHEIFCAVGSYTFDPATEKLVQLFPFEFWQETALLLGVVAILVASIVAIVAHRRLAHARRAEAADASPGLGAIAEAATASRGAPGDVA